MRSQRFGHSLATGQPGPDELVGVGSVRLGAGRADRGTPVPAWNIDRLIRQVASVQVAEDLLSEFGEFSAAAGPGRPGEDSHEGPALASDLGAAREAVMCVREDGIEPAALAAEIGCPHARSRVFLEDLDEDLYDALVSAAPGDFLAPIESEGGRGILLHRLTAKHEPDASDPEVLRRVDDEIVEAHDRELTARRVRRLLADRGAA